jgi:hypothetical protein
LYFSLFAVTAAAPSASSARDLIVDRGTGRGIHRIEQTTRAHHLLARRTVIPIDRGVRRIDRVSRVGLIAHDWVSFLAC